MNWGIITCISTRLLLSRDSLWSDCVKFSICLHILTHLFEFSKFWLVCVGKLCWVFSFTAQRRHPRNYCDWLHNFLEGQWQCLSQHFELMVFQRDWNACLLYCNAFSTAGLFAKHLWADVGQALLLYSWRFVIRCYSIVVVCSKSRVRAAVIDGVYTQLLAR